jgi:hypothetical protein
LRNRQPAFALEQDAFTVNCHTTETTSAAMLSIIRPA